MKLLISVLNLEEARKALNGGCDIIDVKNPAEGSLGANHPKIIREIVRYVNRRVEVSSTIGDLPNLPGTSSLAGLGAASLGVDYVKAGLYGVKEYDDALKMAKWISTAIKEYYSNTKLIICGYGDAEIVGSINPKYIPKIAYESNADGILIDIKTKSENVNIFNFLSKETIANIAEESHNYGLTFALAGGLNIDHVDLLRELKVDIMGVRRGVSNSNNWLESIISEEKVRELYKKINDLT